MASAQTTFELTKPIQDYQPPEKGVEFYPFDQCPDFNELLRKDQAGAIKWHFSEQKDDNAGKARSFWVKLPVKILSEEEVHWLLEIHSIHVDSVRFYYPRGNEYVRSATAGFKKEFNDRGNFSTTNPTYDVPNISDSTFVCYIEVHGIVPSRFVMRFRSTAYSYSYAIHEYYYLGLYYGILTIIAVYSFLLWLRIKERLFIYYSLYAISCILNSFSEDGFGFQFMWPQYPWINQFMGSYLAPSLFLITFILYSSEFLDLKKHLRQRYNIILITTIVYQIYFTFCYFINREWIFGILYTIPFIMMYLVSFESLFKGFKAARYYIVGYSMVVISLVILQLRYLDLIQTTYYIIYSFNFGIIAEVLVLSFAISDKMKLFKDEKEQTQNLLIQELERNNELQEKVNKELEIKVKDRTVELETANKRLEGLAAQLSEFNAKLDRDNWRLIRKVKEETQARILHKNVSFEEFSEAFPDETQCLLFLEKLKWDKGFTCAKCGNQRFKDLVKLRSKKCTRCNHIESAPSKTLFHGVKFSLNKAFYIAYITASEQKITLEDLSKLLELSINTCSKFRNKTKERIQLYKEMNKKETLSSWEEIIPDWE